jgi:DNA-nicking Smr family endonuclease
MTEKDWEEFKKKVSPLEKKNNLLKKNNKKLALPHKKQEEKFEEVFFYEEKGEEKHLEKNTLRKIKKGKIKIQSKLDLHGFTVEESKEKVAKFILKNYEFNKRLLLIITGKGKRLDVSEGWKGTGKLKKNVPIWLRSVQLSKYILWFDSANPENGGEGALMIYLKKSKNEL